MTPPAARADRPGTPPESASAPARLRRWLEVVLATGPSFAWDSDTVVYLSNDAGHYQPWAVPKAGGTPRRLYPAPDRVGDIRPSPAGPEAVVTRDTGGNEHWQLVSLPLGGRGSGPRPLTDAPAVIHQSVVWDRSGERVLFTSNARDRRFFDVYTLRPRTSEPPRLLRREDAYVDVLDARNGRVLVARRTTNLDSDLFLGDGDEWEHLNPHEGEQIVLDATLGEEAVYAAANPGRERTALVRFRPGAASPEFLREYPGDVESVRASPSGDSVLLSYNRDGWSETHLYGLSTAEDRPLTSGPKGVIGRFDFAPDGTGYAFSLSSTEGQEIYYRSIETGKERRLTRSSVPPPARPVAPTLASIRASDGLRVPYWEYAPAGPARGTIVLVHGGPESQARPGFSPAVQFLVGEGYRVVAPNIRGSFGYGRSYVHLDDREKRMDAVRDLKEIVGALAAAGKAPPGRVGVIGGSYGGFMVLAALTTYPDLFAAGVDIVGISNFLTFLAGTGPWRRRLREAEYGSLEHDAELLRSISPLFRADRIVAPLLVVHGHNDPRVPFGEALQIVETLRRLGRTVELLEYPEEGHGLHRRDDQLEAYGRAAEFFDRYLRSGG